MEGRSSASQRGAPYGPSIPPPCFGVDFDTPSPSQAATQGGQNQGTITQSRNFQARRYPLCGFWRRVRALPRHENSRSAILTVRREPFSTQAQLCAQLLVPCFFLGVRKEQAWGYPNLGLLVALLLQFRCWSC